MTITQNALYCRNHEKVGVTRVAWYVVGGIPLCGDCKNGIPVEESFRINIQKSAMDTKKPVASEEQPKMIKTADVVAAKAAGMSVLEIAQKFGVTGAGIHYHLSKGKAQTPRTPKQKPERKNKSTNGLDQGSGSGKYEAVLAQLVLERDKLDQAIAALKNL